LAVIAEVPPAETTVTSTGPTEPEGEVAVIDADESAVIVPAAEPKSTAEAAPKLDPVIVTDVPPVVGPAAGVTLVTTGAGT
jgi:hypothetical protein